MDITGSICFLKKLLPKAFQVLRIGKHGAGLLHALVVRTRRFLLVTGYVVDRLEEIVLIRYLFQKVEIRNNRDGMISE